MANMIALATHDPAAAFVPAPQLQAGLDPVWIATERHGDASARETLLDRAFGPARFGKTCERLRARRLPAASLSLVARAQRHSDHEYGLGGGEVVGSQMVGTQLVGTVRLWHVDAGGVPALMLGPLAVDATCRKSGLGARLMEEALDRARALGHQAIILVGDAPYYARFGFSLAPVAGLEMPGPVEAERFLGLELVHGALADARGVVRATGALDLAARRPARRRLRRAA